MADSVVGLYKTELVRHDGSCFAVDELELATLSWVHWFNRDSCTPPWTTPPPTEHEQAYYRQDHFRPQPRPGELPLH